MRTQGLDSKLFRWWFTTVLLLSFILAYPAMGQEIAINSDLKDKQILVLTSYGYGRPGVEVLLKGFFSELDHSGISVNQVYTEHLDLERAQEPGFRQHLAEALRAKYGHRPLQAIYVVEQPALDFLLNELKDIAPGAPVIIARADLPRPLPDVPHKFITQLLSYDVAGTLQQALELFPGTTQVLVVTGSTDSDKAVAAQAGDALKAWAGHVSYKETSHLSMEQIQAEVAIAVPDRIILVLPLNRDGAGHSAVQMETAIRVADAAKSPVFTLWDNLVGRGAVGGSVTNFMDIGQQAGQLTVSLLTGRRTLNEAQTTVPSPFTSKFDWAQIKRWGGDVSRLPTGSVFINRPATLWDQYQRTVIITLAILLAQSALIAGLLIQRRLRKIAQDNLKASEERFRVLVEQAPEAILVFTLDTMELAEANSQAESLFGCTREQLERSGILSFFKGDRLEPDRIADAFRTNAMDTLEGRQILMETTIQRANGEERQCEVRLVSLPSVARKLIRASFIDITERKEAVEAVVRSEKELRLLAEAMPQIVWICQPDGKTVYFNQQWMDYTGLTREESLGDGWLKPFHPEDQKHAWGAWIKAVHHHGTYSLECRLQGKDGTYRWWLIRGVPVLDKQGEILKWFGTCTDINDLKLAEEERLKLLERLGQSQKMEALGVLVAGVAHNLNNVLAAIMGSASMRETQAADAKDVEAFRIINTACKRGRDVVRSLVQFARPSISDQSPLEIHELLRELRTLLGNTTQNRIQIVEEFGEGPFWVLGDAGNLSNALMNICINALHAMPDRGSLTFRTVSSDKDWVEVSIQDSGAGMKPDVLAHAIEPFFTTKEVGKGTGLGLSMTHGVIKAHGGYLNISSQEGWGTVVTLRLPRIAPPVSGKPSPPAPVLGPLKILLVDDEEDVRFLVSRMLHKAGGIQVKAVAGGAEALESLRSDGVPDVVILDLNMPKMDGVETMRRIKDIHPTIPILISSGRPGIQDWDCFKDPGVRLLSKPFDAEELRRALAPFCIGGQPASPA